MGYSGVVGAFYFLAVFLVVACLNGAIQIIAPGSEAAAWLSLHFFTVIIWMLGIFVAYMLGLSFWQAFFPRKDGSNRNG